MDFSRGAAEIRLQGQTLTLLPERAAFWQERKTLLVADAHFGKASAFRASAIAVPGGTTLDGIERLRSALVRTRAERLIFLGDLLHARGGRSEAMESTVTEWRQAFAQLDCLLVRGNHDRSAGDPPAAWRISCVDQPHDDSPFQWLHEPEAPAEGRYALAGHVHPAVTMSGAGDHLQLPCFFFGSNLGLLPAFGAFTGSVSLRPRRGDRVFVIAGGDVIDKSPHPLADGA